MHRHLVGPTVEGLVRGHDNSLFCQGRFGVAGPVQDTLLVVLLCWTW